MRACTPSSSTPPSTLSIRWLAPLVMASALGWACRPAVDVPELEPPASREAVPVVEPEPEWLGPPGTWAVLHFRQDDPEFRHLQGLSEVAASFCEIPLEEAAHHVDIAVGRDLSTAIWIEDDVEPERALCMATVIAGFLQWPEKDAHVEPSERGTLVVRGDVALEPVPRALIERIVHEPGMVSLAATAGEGEDEWSLDVEVVSRQVRVSVGVSSEPRATELEAWMRRGLAQESAEQLHALGVVRKGRWVHLGLEDADPLFSDHARSPLISFQTLEGSSMLPNAASGEALVYDRVPPEHGHRRGDVVVFPFPIDREPHAARIVALSGERFRWVGSSLEIEGVPTRLEPTDLDGAALDLPEAEEIVRGRVFREHIGDAEYLVMPAPPPDDPAAGTTLRPSAWQVVPEGYVIARHDNRSVEPWHFAVRVEDIDGIVRTIAYSAGADGVRHARMGRTQ